MPESKWDILKRGEIAEGLSQMRESFLQKPNPSHTMELGIAYLWLEDYASAAHHFDDANTRQPYKLTCFYGLSGVAHWGMEGRKIAILRWLEGLRCRSADSRGAGIQLPLLLYAASILAPELYPFEDAMALLKTKQTDRRARPWPGALVDFLVSDLRESELAKYFVGDNKSETNLRIAQSKVFIGMHKFANGDTVALKEALKTTLHLTWRELDNDRNFFLGRLWQDDFHLARYEMKKLARVQSQNESLARPVPK